MVAGTRRISADEAARIAKLLGVPPPGASAADLAENTYYPLEKGVANPLAYVKCVGEVAAGVWKDMVVGDFDEFEIPIPVDPRWPKDAVSALIVRGDSINNRASEGDYVVVLAAEAAPRDVQNGDWVIAERVRGDLRETTVKRVVMRNGGILLCPDSSDPRFTPLVLGADGDDVVRVVAFVLDFVRPATRF